MKERRRKFISMVMAAIMMVTLIPSMAFADGGHTHSFDGTTHACSCGAHEDCVNGHQDWTGLAQNDFTTRGEDVLSTSGNYYLIEDITLSYLVKIKENCTVNLCLNGHVINCGNKYQAFIFTGSSSTLNIYDCKDTVHYFTDEKKIEDEVDVVSGKDGRFDTYQANYDTSGKTEGTDYIAVEGGAFTNSQQLFVLNSNKTSIHLNMYAGTIIGCNCEDNLIDFSTNDMQSSLILNGVTIRDNNLYGAGLAISSYRATVELNDSSIFSNYCASVMTPKGDVDGPQKFATVVIKDSSIYNNTINEYDVKNAVFCKFCNVTFKGKVLLKDNLCNGQQHNFVSEYFVGADISQLKSNPFTITDLTSDENSIGISFADSMNVGEKVTVCDSVGGGEQVVL